MVRSHLADVEERANDLFLRLVKDYAASEYITKQLKSENPLEWVRRMNAVREAATEIVNYDLIYA